MMYTAGAIGSVTGWFDYTDAYVQQVVRDAPVGKVVPSWLWQYEVMSKAQSVFSHFEPHLRDGDLVAGSKQHPYTADPTDSPPLPLYTLDLQGETSGANATAYVFARKRKSTDAWLVTAWASVGEERDVVATLPGVGDVTLRARPAGSVYTIDRGASGVTTRLVDVDPLNPSALLFR